MANSQTKYHLHLKGYVGGYDFDSDYVDYILAKYPDSQVNVLIDSLGGSLATALSVENRAKLVSVLPSREGNWRRQKFPQIEFTPNTIKATGVI